MEMQASLLDWWEMLKHSKSLVTIKYRLTLKAICLDRTCSDILIFKI